VTIRLVLVLLGALGLGGTAELLGTVLSLLALLSGGLLDLGSGTDTDETVVRLELLQGLSGVVDQGEASALATTVLRAEAEDGDLILVGLVETGELVAQLILGDVGTVGVEDINDHLSPGKQRVADELARPQGNGSVGHGCRFL
jgi:hypothetical protein